MEEKHLVLDKWLADVLLRHNYYIHFESRIWPGLKAYYFRSSIIKVTVLYYISSMTIYIYVIHI